MPAHEKTRQHAVDHFVVTHDHPTDFFTNRMISLDELSSVLLHRVTEAHRGPFDLGFGIWDLGFDLFARSVLVSIAIFPDFLFRFE